MEHRIKNEHVCEMSFNIPTIKTKLPFINSFISGKLPKEKVLTFPHASSQHGATILVKWEDHYSQTSSVSSKISEFSYLKLMTMVPYRPGYFMH